jgi:hypothetical protein
MAKPRELFTTPAPQAMGQMGAGIAEAYANVGRIHGQGMAAMGESIGKGIQAGVSAYTEHLKETKQIESQNKSFESLLKNSEGRKLLGMDKASAEQFLAEAKQLNARDQNQMFNFALPNMMQQNFVMQKMGKDFNYDMAKMGVSNENAINLLGLQALLNSKQSGGAVAPNYSVMPASTQPTSTNTETFRPRKFTISTGSTSWTP